MGYIKEWVDVDWVIYISDSAIVKLGYNNHHHHHHNHQRHHQSTSSSKDKPLGRLSAINPSIGTGTKGSRTSCAALSNLPTHDDDDDDDDDDDNMMMIDDYDENDDDSDDDDDE